MGTRKKLLLAALLFILGSALYVYAVLSTFNLQLHASSSLVIATLVLAGGLGAVALGYASVIIIGGRLSLKLAELIARLTRSRHVVEVVNEEPSNIGYRVTRGAFVFYMPALVFILSMTLGWDVHNLHDPRTSIFHPLLHSLDVFSSTDTDLVSYCVSTILPMIILIAIAGIAPSTALPYFRKFKITGVNSGPFHTDFLLTVIGFIVGLGTILTLLGLVYEVLWIGKGPSYYHYVIPTMLGLSLHYSIGAFLGQDKSENMIRSMLEANTGERVIRGKLNIQETRVKDDRKE